MVFLERKIAFSRFATLLCLILIGVPVLAFAQQQFALLTSESVVVLTNEARIEEGLVPYHENRMLTAAAEEKAHDMATRSYFSHSTPEGEKTWNLVRQNGYTFSRVGENLAVKFSDPSHIVSSWLASPGHRANLLNEKFIDIGVGIAEGMYQGATTTFVVALYAAPLNVESEMSGEVKGDQEPSQESAGLMAALEPELSEPESTFVKKDEARVVAEAAPSQVAAASVGLFETLRRSVVDWLGLLFSAFGNIQ